MKIVNSLKSMKTRHKACRVIRRKGRVYVITAGPRLRHQQAEPPLQGTPGLSVRNGRARISGK